MELAAILMLFLVTCSLLVSKNNISPSFLLSGSFFSVYFLQSIFAADMYSSTTATLIIFLISAFFILGEITGTVLLAENSYRLINKEAVIGRNNLNSDQYKTRVAVIIKCLGILAVIGTYKYIVALGIFDSGDISSSILRIGAIREKIFTDEIYVSFFDRIGFLLSYTGVVLSIFYWYFFGWRWWLLIPSAAVLGLGMAQAGRAGIIIVILQWILALYIKAKTTGDNRLRSKIIFMGTLIFIIFVFIQVFREGLDNFNSESLTRTISSLRGYFFGGVSAFAFYIDNIFDVNSISYGRYSFSSLFSFLGIYEQEPGIYDFYAAISDYGEATNIYTAYRSFIDDFSLLGAVAFYAISGFILSIFAQLFVRGYNLHLAILVPAMSWIICSPMVSLTYFNSFLLSIICPYIILRSAAFRLKYV
jgi:oligosaccharide repeat unit polymerase